MRHTYILVCMYNPATLLFFLLTAVLLLPWHTLFGGIWLCLLLLAVVVFVLSWRTLPYLLNLLKENHACLAQ